MRPIPSSALELLEALAETFPESVPSPTDSPELIHHRAGARSVILMAADLISQPRVRFSQPARRGAGR